MRILLEESIDNWETFERLFVQNFKSTCKKPTSIEQLRTCTQKLGESNSALEPHKNSAEHVSDERAIDVFIGSIRRRDLVEELGRVNPRTVAELMDIANMWVDGEAAVYNKRHRSPEEDRNRTKNQNRRRFRSFVEYDGPRQVSAGFRSNNGSNHREDYRMSGGQRSDNRDVPNTSRPSNRSRYNMSPEEIMNGPCQMHFYRDPEGRRALGHVQKGCRTFQALRRIIENTQTEEVNRGYAPGLRSEVHVPLPPPPAAITNGNQQNQLQIAGPSNTNIGYS
jgi:hypothetical protein